MLVPSRNHQNPRNAIRSLRHVPPESTERNTILKTRSILDVMRGYMSLFAPGRQLAKSALHQLTDGWKRLGSPGLNQGQHHALTSAPCKAEDAPKHPRNTNDITSSTTVGNPRRLWKTPVVASGDPRETVPGQSEHPKKKKNTRKKMAQSTKIRQEPQA